MRCKNMIFSVFLILLCAVIPSMAAEYPIHILSRPNTYDALSMTIGNGREAQCIALTPNTDGSFDTQQNVTNNQRIYFYSNETCSGRALGNVNVRLNLDVTKINITINNTRVTASVTASYENAPKKTIRFFVPWTNTNAILYVAGGKSDTMTTIKNFCGWFEAKVTPPEGSFQVYFKQTLGYEYVTDIHNSIKITPIEQSTLLSLDEAAAQADTIWVKAGKDIGAATTIYTKYPGVLGDCPTKTLPVMMFDWLHGTNGDGDDEGSNGDPANGVSADFGSSGCAHHTRGMVQEMLGPNGVPIPADPFPEDCKITTHLAQWFLPEVLATKNGVPYTNATCRSIELSLQNDGLWLGQKDDNSTEGGLFLLDDFEYLDAEKTIPNPYFDNISGRGKRHNYGFTMKIQATFEYIPGQYFEFNGDDDVWVFINNRLVVDIGGQHTKVFGAVNLDTLGLQEGKNYPFHIFYAERHTTQSNFMMRTSIDLKTEASILAKDLSDAGLINYEIFQRISKQALSCDFSGATTTDTVAAPSNFTLIGSGAYAEGVPLDSVGVWFGGIVIKPGYTGFTIDTAQIKSKRALPPGTYQLRFSLQKDESQYDEITFVIDKYAALPIVYARIDNQNQWISLGSEVDGTVDTLGKWVNTRYPVNIMLDDGAAFDDMVYVITNNPAVIPCDENGTPITAITLKNGKATFYVKATAPVQGIKIIVSSADESQQAIWKNISFMDPPVPQVVFACIFDRDGDGRGDSVYAKLSKPYGNTQVNNYVKLDSIQLEFGEKFPTILNINEIKTSAHDSTMIITTAGGFGAVPFTGGAESIYSGKITPFWKYQDAPISLTSDVTDSIGPVITSADISYSDDGSTVLLVSFSEGLDCEDEVAATYFTYFFRQTAMERQDIVPDIIAKEKKFRWRLIFRSSSNDKENIPVMGDSIKLVPGVHMDLLHRSTPVTNPYVRISGEQKVVVTSAPVVTIGESDVSREIITSPTPTIPKIVPADQSKTAKEIATEYGAQGHYLGDLSLSSLVKDEVTNIEAAIKNANQKAIEKEGKKLTDLIVEKGVKAVDKEYDLGKEFMNAYSKEIISLEDIKEITKGNSAITAKITKKLAEETKLRYQTKYFTSLGIFVNSTSGSFSCIDTSSNVNKPYNGNCLDKDNDGKIFLAWNMRSKKGRLVGTGVYIARLTYEIKIGSRTVVDRTQDFLWGVRHGKTKGFTIDLRE